MKPKRLNTSIKRNKFHTVYANLTLQKSNYKFKNHPNDETRTNNKHPHGLTKKQKKRSNRGGENTDNGIGRAIDGPLGDVPLLDDESRGRWERETDQFLSILIASSTRHPRELGSRSSEARQIQGLKKDGFLMMVKPDRIWAGRGAGVRSCRGGGSEKWSSKCRSTETVAPHLYWLAEQEKFDALRFF